jgi:hypothetical protein
VSWCGRPAGLSRSENRDTVINRFIDPSAAGRGHAPRTLGIIEQSAPRDKFRSVENGRSCW